MTVSMRVMSAGDGYKYLLKTVVAGDGNRALSTPLTRCYAEAGTPPGRWLGSGVASLGAGRIVAGSQVSETQLQLLVGMGRDPLTGVPLGRAYPVYAPLADRIEKRVADLDPSLGIDVTGLIATAYDHYDSRAGDPHLHTHVVVSNKVRTVLDGKWRSLDSRFGIGLTRRILECIAAGTGVDRRRRARHQVGDQRQVRLAHIPQACGDVAVSL